MTLIAFVPRQVRIQFPGRLPRYGAWEAIFLDDEDRCLFIT